MLSLLIFLKRRQHNFLTHLIFQRVVIVWVLCFYVVERIVNKDVIILLIEFSEYLKSMVYLKRSEIHPYYLPTPVQGD